MNITSDPQQARLRPSSMTRGDGKYTVSIDYDGVLSDFDAAFKNAVGITAEQWSKDYYSKHGPKANHLDEIWRIIVNIDGFWTEAPKMADCDKIIDMVVDGRNRGAADEINILTALPALHDKNRAMKDKPVWLIRNIKYPLAIKWAVQSYGNWRGSDKADFCEGPNHILIDDSISNVNSWNNAGGIGLLYKAGQFRDLRENWELTISGR